VGGSPAYRERRRGDEAPRRWIRRTGARMGEGGPGSFARTRRGRTGRRSRTAGEDDDDDTEEKAGMGARNKYLSPTSRWGPHSSCRGIISFWTFSSLFSVDGKMRDTEKISFDGIFWSTIIFFLQKIMIV
jgi:hypothetical protein